MKEFIFLMHNNGSKTDPDKWPEYFNRLNEAGVFLGGSSIGKGLSISQNGESSATTEHLSGYIKIKAADIEQAKEFVKGNPVYEAGGTVEIRELPKD